MCNTALVTVTCKTSDENLKSDNLLLFFCFVLCCGFLFVLAGRFLFGFFGGCLCFESSYILADSFPFSDLDQETSNTNKPRCLQMDPPLRQQSQSTFRFFQNLSLDGLKDKSQNSSRTAGLEICLFF